MTNPTQRTDPIRPTDDEARSLAQTLMQSAGYAALATITATGAPLVTRVAFGLCPAGQPISLISSLAAHTQALQDTPAASLLVGEPGEKGDPLTHPRLSLMAQALFVDNQSPQHADLAAHYLRSHPKAKLYIGFADFSFVRFEISEGLLNGGFGKAFHLTPADLSQPG
ncbi:heme utilization protein HutZ [Phaeobacter sp. CECT 5382]|uniref:HugZ family pyridoxamine 5'-phosphate oxidase n=1 Tax=Phaeobacter sp. CECT 5382 TaxID=1712645 RepID=UPI0006DAF522|nr:pyridoxamine 5'-phosphate oxidase family protein [Phaeobacter sp. CECT 5382]CUH89561.1 heme utilization protein HutZ [Phaeobacter sp. CECT 5382]